MLDECRGERLEEVLAVFSAAVLKKCVAERQEMEGEHPAISQTLALETWGYSGDRAHLNALVLAHQVSLSSVLRDKAVARDYCNDFSELLDLKQRTISKRREQIKSQETEALAADIQPLSDAQKLDVWRRVRNNWSGNERWMESLLHGDVSNHRDGVLETPYERVWRRVQSGRLTELEEQSSKCLLELLDRRIKVQSERLEQWRDFRRKLTTKASKNAHKVDDQPVRSSKGVDLAFDSHQYLHPAKMSPRKRPTQMSRQLEGQYANLVASLKAELQAVDYGSTQSFRESLSSSRTALEKTTGTHLQVAVPDEESISELSELDDDAEPYRPLAPYAGAPFLQEAVEPATDPVKRRSTERSRSPPKPPTRTSTTKSSESTYRANPPSKSPPRRIHRTPSTSPRRSPTKSLSPAKSAVQYSPEAADVQAAEPVSPTQQLADQILASMNSVSPSPIKKPRHTLSLAERTRLSMARGTHPALQDDEEPDPHSLPIRRRKDASTAAVAANGRVSIGVGSCDPGMDEEVEEGETLAARTRKSMAGFEAARQRAQIERRRSQRKSRHLPPPAASRGTESYYPVLEEGDGDSTMIAEELMAGDPDDVEAIFKSRPRIMNSPLSTPVRGSD
jgi:hypothetical protein